MLQFVQLNSYSLFGEWVLKTVSLYSLQIHFFFSQSVSTSDSSFDFFNWKFNLISFLLGVQTFNLMTFFCFSTYLHIVTLYTDPTQVLFRNEFLIHLEAAVHGYSLLPTSVMSEELGNMRASSFLPLVLTFWLHMSSWGDCGQIAELVASLWWMLMGSMFLLPVGIQGRRVDAKSLTQTHLCT